MPVHWSNADSAPATQKRNLRPNWIWRAVLAVLDTRPKFPLDKLLSGIPQTGVFKALNNSARNSSSLDSVNGNFRKNDRSSALNPSDRSVLRPRLPKVNGAGTSNALLFNQLFGPWSEGTGSPTSTLTPDPAKACLWYRHTFRNTGRRDSARVATRKRAFTWLTHRSSSRFRAVASGPTWTANG